MAISFLTILGSVRESTPPRPARLGERVAKALHGRVAHCGLSELIDPLDWPLGTPFKPHFAYAAGQAPAHLDELAQKISAADAFVMVSPEYNHSMSPALANLLNHFGSSLFAWKPSLIVTYSAGQWGGTRAAIGMRSFLSELGCLPVSAMIHVPRAQEIFDEGGGYKVDADPQAWADYLARGINQLTWWAEAAQKQRAIAGDPSEAFLGTPAQRNAPSRQ